LVDNNAFELTFLTLRTLVVNRF